MDDLEPMTETSWTKVLSGWCDEDVSCGLEAGIDAGWQDVLDRVERELDSESQWRRWFRPVRNWWHVRGRRRRAA